MAIDADATLMFSWFCDAKREGYFPLVCKEDVRKRAQKIKVMCLKPADGASGAYVVDPEYNGETGNAWKDSVLTCEIDSSASWSRWLSTISSASVTAAKAMASAAERLRCRVWLFPVIPDCARYNLPRISFLSVYRASPYT